MATLPETAPGLRTSSTRRGLTRADERRPARLAATSPLPGPDTEQWDRLALLAGNIFGTREWHDCWWRQFGHGRTPWVLTDDDADPRVVLPLYRSGTLIRQLRAIGNGQSDQLGPVCAPSDSGIAAAMLGELLDDPRPAWDVLLLHDIPVDAAWAPGDGWEVRRVASPVARLETRCWSDYLQGRSRHFRQQLRSRSARLYRDFAPTFRLATAETLTADLESLFRLHRLRWGRHAPFAARTQRAFHTDFAAVAQARGWLRLWILELDGRPVGASHCFRFASADYQYQGGWDPAFERYSPGFLLCANTVRSAVEDGMGEFRFLRGPESHKLRFADLDRPVRTLALASGWRGRAAISTAQRRPAR